MGIADRLYDAVGIKAEPAARSKVQPEPNFRGGGDGRYAIGTAKTHARAYGGGKDGVDWFYDAANIIAKQAATARFHFKTAAGDKQVLHREPDHPEEIKETDAALTELFEQPNPWMGWQEHLFLAVIDLLSVGNFFWLKWQADDDGNKPLALYRLSPALLEVVPGKGKRAPLVDHYAYGEGSERMKIPPQHIVHGRLPNPHSPHNVLGLGVVQAAPQVMDIELGMLKGLRSFFDRGTVLAGALESDRTIPEPQRKKSAREFQRMNSSSSNWYNVAFLERGLRYRPIQANAQEAGYEALSKTSRDRIFAMLGVPRILAGIDDGEMKLQEGRRFLAEDTMPFILDIFKHNVTVALTQAWGLRFEWDYGYQLPEEDRIAVAEQFSVLPGIKLKEARAKAGLPPLGPEFKDESGVLLDDYVLNMPGPSTENPGGSPDPQGEGAPPDRENVPRFQQSPNAGNRDGTAVNGDRPSAADNSRRRTAGVARPRPAGKGGPITAELLANGSLADLITAGGE